MTKMKIAGAGIAVLVVLAGIAFFALKQRAAHPGATVTPEKIAAANEQIRQVNANYPTRMVEAKTLIMTSIMQKRIPAAGNWCDTLNAAGRLWPATPTNTVFALNSKMAGVAYTRGMRGDVVTYFETASAGWNQCGGAELLARKADGVAVAFADGRALIVPAAEVAKLRWSP